VVNLKIPEKLTEPQSSRQLLQQSLHFSYLPREGRVAGQVFQFERVGRRSSDAMKRTLYAGFSVAAAERDD